MGYADAEVDYPPEKTAAPTLYERVAMLEADLKDRDRIIASISERLDVAEGTLKRFGHELGQDVTR